METPADPPREPEPDPQTPGLNPERPDTGTPRQNQLLAAENPVQPEQPAVPVYLDRSDVPWADRWRLEDIFATDAAWETELAALAGRIADLAAYQGRLADDALTLAAALDLSSALDEAFAELQAYAHMRRDEDHSLSLYQDMNDRVTGQYYDYAARTAFLLPELARIDPAVLDDWLNSTPALAAHRQPLREVIRNRPHILSEAEESLLSRFGPVNEGIGDVFSMLDTVDINLGSITGADGQPLPLTHARFAQLREDPDRRLRADSFRQVHQAYAGMGQTLATLYSLRVKADLLFSAARRHPDALSAALFADNLPADLYHNLITTIHGGQPVLNRYFALRRQLLDLPDLHIYDTYLPLSQLPPRHFSYSEAAAMVRDSLQILGPEYLAVVDQHLADRWIDVYETPGKANGAYSWGTYRTHPFILLNYSGMLSDVFTLAHELGHSLHTWYANRHQPFTMSHYPIFLAEIASTVNENLLMHHLLSQCDTTTVAGRTEKIWLLSHFLETFRLTVFRQTMFAEFEWQVHHKARQGESLTADSLGRLYRDLLSQYFGPDVVIDDFMQWEWARIPHFYSAFYVYKYATGFAAAVAISQAIRQQGDPAVARYLAFLAAGGSDYPLDLLQQAGVDMLTPLPVEAALAAFAASLDELASLVAQDRPASAGPPGTPDLAGPAV